MPDKNEKDNSDDWKYDAEHNHWGKCYPNEENCEVQGQAEEDLDIDLELDDDKEEK